MRPRQTMGLVTAVTTALLLLCPAAAGAAMMRWCPSWQAQYVDAGRGEDLFTSSSLKAYPAEHALAKVTDSGGAVLYDGPVAQDGCTNYFEIHSDSTYKLVIWTELRWGADRSFRVMSDLPGAGPLELELTFETETVGPSTKFSFHTTSALHTPQTNVAPVAGLILRKHHDLNYTAGTSTTIYTDSGTCPISSYRYHGDVCVMGDFGGEDHTSWKFITAHEVGHRQADATGGPLAGQYDHSCPAALCGCDHVTDAAGTGEIRKHCLQSREYMGAAESEGWAQFYAAATFNHHESTSCSLSYYKEILQPDGTILPPPHAIDCTAPVRWMNTQCNPGYQHLGVEWDWLVFFWGLYTDTDRAFSMAEMAAIWSATPPHTTWVTDLTADPPTAVATIWGETWDDLLRTTETIHGARSLEAGVFLWWGLESGVGYYL